MGPVWPIRSREDRLCGGGSSNSAYTNNSGDRVPPPSRASLILLRQRRHDAAGSPEARQSGGNNASVCQHRGCAVRPGQPVLHRHNLKCVRCIVPSRMHALRVLLYCTLLLTCALLIVRSRPRVDSSLMTFDDLLEKNTRDGY